MEEKIILTTVKLLDRLGVKFTIDDIAKQLGIAKKTVYKYFDGKEEIAKRVFAYIISCAEENQKTAIASDKNEVEKLTQYLVQYMEILRLQSDKIFNLFSLSDKLLGYVKDKADENWNEFITLYDSSRKTVESHEALRLTVDGALKNVYSRTDRRQISKACIKLILEGAYN